MEQVAADTHVLGTRGHNFYVLRDGDEVTVIDAGCSREWSKLERGLASIGLTLDSVRGIVATHAHADHFGFAKRAGEAEVPVSVHEDEETRATGRYTGRFSAGTSDLPIFNRFALRNFVPMVLAGVMQLEPVEQVNLFTDGETLDLPGAPRAVHTPGHTEGHTMFHCGDRGLLFTGDGLCTMQLLGPATGPRLIEPVFHLNMAQALDSLDKITGLDAELILPGHGAPWSGKPADAVALAREAAAA